MTSDQLTPEEPVPGPGPTRRGHNLRHLLLRHTLPALWATYVGALCWFAYQFSVAVPAHHDYARAMLLLVAAVVVVPFIVISTLLASGYFVITKQPKPILRGLLTVALAGLMVYPLVLASLYSSGAVLALAVLVVLLHEKLLFKRRTLWLPWVPVALLLALFEWQPFTTLYTLPWAYTVVLWAWPAVIALLSIRDTITNITTTRNLLVTIAVIASVALAAGYVAQRGYQATETPRNLIRAAAVLDANAALAAKWEQQFGALYTIRGTGPRGVPTINPGNFPTPGSYIPLSTATPMWEGRQFLVTTRLNGASIPCISSEGKGFMGSSTKIACLGLGFGASLQETTVPSPTVGEEPEIRYLLLSNADDHVDVEVAFHLNPGESREDAEAIARAVLERLTPADLGRYTGLQRAAAAPAAVVRSLSFS